VGAARSAPLRISLRKLSGRGRASGLPPVMPEDAAVDGSGIERDRFHARAAFTTSALAPFNVDASIGPRWSERTQPRTAGFPSERSSPNTTAPTDGYSTATCPPASRRRSTSSRPFEGWFGGKTTKPRSPLSQCRGVDCGVLASAGAGSRKDGTQSRKTHFHSERDTAPPWPDVLVEGEERGED
jgi:hypothetical protein